MLDFKTLSMPHVNALVKPRLAQTSVTEIIDAETKGTTQFRNPRAQGCSVPSIARVLLRAQGFL